MVWLWVGYPLAGLATLLAAARWSRSWRAQAAGEEGWLLIAGTLALWPLVWWYALTTLVSIFRYARREGVDWREVVEAMRR